MCVLCFEDLETEEERDEEDEEDGASFLWLHLGSLLSLIIARIDS